MAMLRISLGAEELGTTEAAVHLRDWDQRTLLLGREGRMLVKMWFKKAVTSISALTGSLKRGKMSRLDRIV